MNNLEILIQIMELNSGIIPHVVWFKDSNRSPEFLHRGINEDRWSSMTEEERFFAKRKFRKVFRKACKRFNVDSRLPWCPRDKTRLVRKFMAESCVKNRDRMEVK